MCSNSSEQIPGRVKRNYLAWVCLRVSPLLLHKSSRSAPHNPPQSILPPMQEPLTPLCLPYLSALPASAPGHPAACYRHADPHLKQFTPPLRPPSTIPSLASNKSLQLAASSVEAGTVIHVCLLWKVFVKPNSVDYSAEAVTLLNTFDVIMPRRVTSSFILILFRMVQYSKLCILWFTCFVWMVSKKILFPWLCLQLLLKPFL